MDEVRISSDQPGLQGIDQVKSAILQHANEHTKVIVDQAIFEDANHGALGENWKSWVERFAVDHEMQFEQTGGTLAFTKNVRPELAH